MVPTGGFFFSVCQEHFENHYPIYICPMYTLWQVINFKLLWLLFPHFGGVRGVVRLSSLCSLVFVKLIRS